MSVVMKMRVQISLPGRWFGVLYWQESASWGGGGWGHCSEWRAQVGGETWHKGGCLAPSTSASWTVTRHSVPYRSPVSIQFRGIIPLSPHRKFLNQLDISSLLPLAPFPLTARFTWKSAVHKKQLRLWKHNLIETQGKAVYFGDMAALHFLTGIYQWLQYYW